MSTQRIGELLREMVPLSLHDVDEILLEQTSALTKKTFGNIALSMGLCRPEHVTRAWFGQLLEGPPKKIDLERVGIDTQALSHISAEVAHELGVMPVRVVGDYLIVAISSNAIALAATQLPSRVTKQLRFALADPGAIRRALAKHYPRVPVSS